MITRLSVTLLMFFTALSLRAGESVPQILILGDAVYQESYKSIGNDLKGVARIVYTTSQSGVPCDSAYVRKNIDALLSEKAPGNKQWDLIIFNVGLVDLMYKAPNMMSFRALPKSAGGIRSTTPQAFEENLTAIIKRLKTSGSKVMWANITPTAHVTSPLFDTDSEIPFNKIAEKVMKAQGIPITDMHTHVTNLIKESKDKRKVNKDSPFYVHQLGISQPITDFIVKTCGIKKPAETKPPAKK